MTNSEVKEMYWHLVYKCSSFEQKKEYVLEHPELYSTSSLVILNSIIESIERSTATAFRLHRNLLSEIGTKGVEDTFRDYGYVDENIALLFFQYVTDPNTGITASNILAQDKLCKLDNITKIRLMNWFIAGYPDHEHRIPYLKTCIGLK